MISGTTLREYLTVHISADQDAAVLRGSLPPDVHIDTALLREYLFQSNVRNGILDISQEVLDQKLHETSPVMIAQGVKPENGIDGWIEYLFDTNSAKPTVDQRGKVNLHEIHFLHNVHTGDILARIHPPTAGTPGYRVNGEQVLPRPGKKGDVRTGPYTALGPDDSSVVIATADGNVILHNDGQIEVQPIVTIKGNIDFSTGNIDFVGSLNVMGDILADFSVKVQKDLTVYGSVEDSFIEVGGNVIVKKGFIGSGKGRISAQGNITVHTLLNQTIVCGQDVTIEKEAVSGMIKAGGKILAQHAIVVGTTLESDIEVVIRNLGNRDGASGRVRVGKKGKILERIAQIDKEIKLTERQVIEVKDAVYRLVRMKIDKGCLGDECEQKLTKLQEVQKMLPKKNESLHQEKIQLSTELEKQFDGRIVVHGTVFENVCLEINGARKMIEDAIQGVLFVERGGELDARVLD
jgi:uncharacterized protein